MATDYVGLPFNLDSLRNWGLLELDEDEILVHLFDKHGKKSYQIESQTWEYSAL